MPKKMNSHTVKAAEIKANTITPHEYWFKGICELAYPANADVPFNTAWEELKSLYNEPHRRYHNWNHPRIMLDMLVKNLSPLREEFQFYSHIPISMRELLDIAPHLILAILYHDAIYKPGSQSNEIDSAELVFLHLGKHSKLAKAIASLVVITKHHTPTFYDVWEKILIDLDLHFLGLTPIEYAANTDELKDEYSSVYTPEQFDIGRKEFCKNFLQRAVIFQTNTFRDKYEKQARENLRFGSL